ncbi:MAG: excinuclease ABC subunit UvrC [Candidatus Jordarchaeaceae archaeon]
MEGRVREAPEEPGVYIMRDVNGKVIYVGKARNLRSRVRSYFGASKKTDAKDALVNNIASLEYIVTGDETEAMILECDLIKKYQPRYNVAWKDSKKFPYIKVTVNEEIPRVLTTRELVDDGARYFGPYTRFKRVKENLKYIRRLFGICGSESAVQMSRMRRPCLEYHINNCSAPCVGKISREEYLNRVEQLLLFLAGEREELVEQLYLEMEKASQELRFEDAAKIRDRIAGVEKAIGRQKILSTKSRDTDIIALEKLGRKVCIELLFLQSGRIVDKKDFVREEKGDAADEELLGGFVKQFYIDAEVLPEKIVVESDFEDRELVERWLEKRKGEKVEIRTPITEEEQERLNYAKRIAVMVLNERMRKSELERELTLDAARDLQKLLSLPEPPVRIEAFDVSNILGEDAVGSLIVFEDGRPKKEDYRRFRIKTVKGPDDPQMMGEIVYRRYRGVQERGEKVPNLILVDGGVGQVNAALKSLESLGLNVPVVGLAKRFENLYVPGRAEPIGLPSDSKTLFLLRRVRDEAHRFALSYHKKLREKKIKESLLESIPGVGKKRRDALLKHFGSLENLRKATVEDVMRVPSMSEDVAKRILEYLRGTEDMEE